MYDDEGIVYPAVMLFVLLFSIGAVLGILLEYPWWSIPVATIALIIIIMTPFIIWAIFDERKTQRKRERREHKRENEALVQRADEQHWWLWNGAVESDAEAMNLGIYGNYQPERITND